MNLVAKSTIKRKQHFPRGDIGILATSMLIDSLGFGTAGVIISSALGVFCLLQAAQDWQSRTQFSIWLVIRLHQNLDFTIITVFSAPE